MSNPGREFEVHQKMKNKDTDGDCKCDSVPTCSSTKFKPPTNRSRKPRTIFSQEALRAFNLVFKKNSYPGWDTIGELAKKYRIPDADRYTIQTWFANKRNRTPKDRQQRTLEVVRLDELLSESDLMTSSYVANEAFAHCSKLQADVFLSHSDRQTPSSAMLPDHVIAERSLSSWNNWRSFEVFAPSLIPSRSSLLPQEGQPFQMGSTRCQPFWSTSPQTAAHLPPPRHQMLYNYSAPGDPTCRYTCNQQQFDRQFPLYGLRLQQQQQPTNLRLESLMRDPFGSPENHTSTLTPPSTDRADFNVITDKRWSSTPLDLLPRTGGSDVSGVLVSRVNGATLKCWRPGQDSINY